MNWERWIKSSDPTNELWREIDWNQLHYKIMTAVEQWEETTANDVTSKRINQASTEAKSQKSSSRTQGSSKRSDFADKPART